MHKLLILDCDTDIPVRSAVTVLGNIGYNETFTVYYYTSSIVVNIGLVSAKVTYLPACGKPQSRTVTIKTFAKLADAIWLYLEHAYSNTPIEQLTRPVKQSFIASFIRALRIFI